MKIETKNFIFLFLITIVIGIFFIPELITIYKIKQKLIQLNINIDNYESQKIKFSKNLQESKNISEILQQNRDEEIIKLKKLINTNNFYAEAIDEEKSDAYLTERRNDEMYALIKSYENNNISSKNIINNLKNFFKNNTIEDYYNNISNILLISNIIQNQTDINFIYDKIIYPFYSDKKDDSKKYILKNPCFKASIDSNNPHEFHKKCKDVGDTIMFIKTNKTRFGGITDLSWGKIYTKEDKFIQTKTRLFNLDNQNIFMYNKEQKVSRYMAPIRAENYYFAMFGYNDIFLGFIPWESHSSFPQEFLKNNNTNKDFNDLLNQNNEKYYKDNQVNFEYIDIEVYPIIAFNYTNKE